MSKAKVVQGKNLMLFLSGKALALAKSMTITITRDSLDAASKDDGIWKANEAGDMSWTGAAEAVYSADTARTVDVAYDALFDAMVTGDAVTIIVGMPDNIAAGASGVPEAGWTAPTHGMTGKAIITSLEMSGEKGNAASLSLSLEGVGELTRIPPKTNS